MPTCLRTILEPIAHLKASGQLNRDGKQSIATGNPRTKESAREINLRLEALWRQRSQKYGIDFSKNYGHVNSLPLLIFVHIAKTAGSSFALTLRQNFEPQFLYNIVDETQFEADCQSRLLLDRLEVVAGHGSFNLHIAQKTTRDCCY